MDNTATVADNPIVLTGISIPSPTAACRPAPPTSPTSTSPTSSARSEPLSTVTLSATLLPAGTPFIIGQVEAGSDGSWNIKSDVALADGHYEITATAIDQFGETTTTAPTVITSDLLIDTAGPVIDGMFFNRLNGQVDYIIKDPVNPDGSAPSGVWVNTLLDSSNYLLTKVHANKAYPGKWVVTNVTANPRPGDPLRLRRRRDVQQRGQSSRAASTSSPSATRATATRRCRTSPRTISTASSTARSPRATASTAAISSPSLQAYHNKVFAPQTIIGTAFAGNGGVGEPRRWRRCTAESSCRSLPSRRQPDLLDKHQPVQWRRSPALT